MHENAMGCVCFQLSLGICPCRGKELLGHSASSNATHCTATSIMWFLNCPHSPREDFYPLALPFHPPNLSPLHANLPVSLDVLAFYINASVYDVALLGWFLFEHIIFKGL